MESAITGKDVANGGHATGQNIATSDMAIMDIVVVVVSSIPLYIALLSFLSGK